MRIYAASRGDVVKGALYMIGFVAVMDVAMVLFLEHVLNRTVTLTAQWPIAAVVLGVIAFTARAYNEAASSWIQVTPKQLSWASGPKPAAQGLTPSGAVKLADVTAVSVQLDEVKAKAGRKVVTLSVHRLHAEIDGKPDLVLPVAALESADTKIAPEVLAHGRAQLLRVVEQINANAKGFTVDTSVMGDLTDELAATESSETETTEIVETVESVELVGGGEQLEAIETTEVVEEVAADDADGAEEESATVVESSVVEVETGPETPAVELIAEESVAEVESEPVEFVAEEPAVEAESEAEAADLEVAEVVAEEPAVEAEPELELAPANLEVVELVAEEPAVVAEYEPAELEVVEPVAVEPAPEALLESESSESEAAALVAEESAAESEAESEAEVEVAPIDLEVVELLAEDPLAAAALVAEEPTVSAEIEAELETEPHLAASEPAASEPAVVIPAAATAPEIETVVKPKKPRAKPKAKAATAPAPAESPEAAESAETGVSS